MVMMGFFEYFGFMLLIVNGVDYGLCSGMVIFV